MRNTKLIIGTMAASLAGLGIVVVTSVRDHATPPDHAPTLAPVNPAPPNPPPPQPITPKPQPLPAPVR